MVIRSSKSCKQDCEEEQGTRSNKKSGQFRILAKNDKAMERKSGWLEVQVATLPDLGFCS